MYTVYIADFLRAYKPDVVHFQHTHFIGYDFVTLARRMLPDVPIVYTLHEYLPICHRDGQMVRTKGEALCLDASPRRCNECFPDWTPQYFFLRERLIKTHLAHVDLFLCPEQVPARALRRLGHPAREAALRGLRPACRRCRSRPPSRAGRARRLGFFGQISPYKGVEVLLGGDADPARARRPTSTCSSTAPTSTSCLRTSTSCSSSALEGSGANVTFAGPVRTSPTCRG